MSTKTKSRHVYQPGEIALSCDVRTSRKNGDDAELAALTLLKGDGAFILRSDRTWRFAIVKEVVLNASPPYINFVAQPDGSTKRVDIGHWGDRVRPLKKKKTELLQVVKTEGKEAYLKKGQRVYPVNLDVDTGQWRPSF